MEKTRIRESDKKATPPQKPKPKPPNNQKPSIRNQPERDLGEKAFKSSWRQPQDSHYTGKEEYIKSNLDNPKTKKKIKYKHLVQLAKTYTLFLIKVNKSNS